MHSIHNRQVPENLIMAPTPLCRFINPGGLPFITLSFSSLTFLEIFSLRHLHPCTLADKSALTLPKLDW